MRGEYVGPIIVLVVVAGLSVAAWWIPRWQRVNEARRALAARRVQAETQKR